ncbi:MAG: FISUMP domain-containing protein, partial [Ignavibacteria bacterium]|nr:FISUMP domain-containing protein [Ignavibacteria bacterium]
VTHNGIIEKYCYSNDTANCTTYGGLYDWNEAMQYLTTPGTKGICPTGWHIPTRTEFQTLAEAVSNDGNALKAVGQGTAPDGIGTNTSGFSALLAGIRAYYTIWSSLTLGTSIWSSTQYDATSAYEMGLQYFINTIYKSYNYKESGYSIRCLKD